MAAKTKGVQARHQLDYPKAIFVRCMAHAVSLAISRTVDLKPLHNMYTTLNELGKFFTSPKRNAQFILKLKESNRRKKSAKTVCKTRWTELNSVNKDVLSMFEEFVDTLDNIARSGDFVKETQAKAERLRSSMLTYDFIFMSVVSLE